MLINRGDIYWVTLNSAIPHPYVILQDDLPKRSFVEAGKLTSPQKTQLGPYIGTLAEARVAEISTASGSFNGLPDEHCCQAGCPTPLRYPSF